MASSVPPIPLPVTKSAAFDFSGGDLTSDGGALMLNELAEALGVRRSLARHLAAHPLRTYDDADVAMQKVMLTACGYGSDDDEGSLRDDPAFGLVLGGMASQETMSRRLSAMGRADRLALERAIGDVRARVASLEERDWVVLDIDTTLLRTCGAQEGSAWNFHYGDDGYHPILATDTATGDVVGFELREGAQYCSKDAGAFAGRVVDEVMGRSPRARVALRGDAGFASPEVYLACEERGVAYAVRMKASGRLREMAEDLSSQLEPGVEREVYGEFRYRAGSWDRERRVVCAVSMREGRLIPDAFFVVTNMKAAPSRVMAFYRKRGAMELVIGELKGFLAGAVPRRSMEANAFCCQLGVLAYSLVNWLRRLCLPQGRHPMKPSTTLLRFVKVAARRVSHAGRATFRFCSSFPDQNAVYRAMQRIWQIAQAA